MYIDGLRWPWQALGVHGSSLSDPMNATFWTLFGLSEFKPPSRGSYFWRLSSCNFSRAGGCWFGFPKQAWLSSRGGATWGHACTISALTKGPSCPQQVGSNAEVWGPRWSYLTAPSTCQVTTACPRSQVGVILLRSFGESLLLWPSPAGWVSK